MAATATRVTFGETVARLAADNPDIVVIDADLRKSTMTDTFAQQFPGRFFDVGIAESHAIDMCAGMAKTGLKPFATIYSTFLQRGLDQVFQEVALQGLPVRLCLDRAGLLVRETPGSRGFSIGLFHIRFCLRDHGPRREYAGISLLDFGVGGLEVSL